MVLFGSHKGVIGSNAHHVLENLLKDKTATFKLELLFGAGCLSYRHPLLRGICMHENLILLS